MFFYLSLYQLSGLGCFSFLTDLSYRFGTTASITKFYAVPSLLFTASITFEFG